MEMLALVTALYGAALTAVALRWLRTTAALSWRQVGFVAIALLAMPVIVLSVDFPQGIIGVACWVLLEEVWKVAVIKGLRVGGRVALAVCLSFAGMELIFAKALIAAFDPEMQNVGAFVWLAIVTAPVLVHAATGYVYSALDHRTALRLLGISFAGHFAYNVLTDWFWGGGEVVAAALHLLLAGGLLFAARRFGWRVTLAPQRGLV
ncbi:MAG: hypothetical protein V4808_00320 [Pseudomonadota bacterium]